MSGRLSLSSDNVEGAEKGRALVFDLGWATPLTFSAFDAIIVSRRPERSSPPWPYLLLESFR